MVRSALTGDNPIIPGYVDASIGSWDMGGFFTSIGPSIIGGGGGTSLYDILYAGTELASGALTRRGGSTAVVPRGSASPSLPSVLNPLPGLGQGGVIQVPGWSVGKKYRRMNPCNARALRRAIRRVKRFEKFAKQSIRISRRVKVAKGRTRCR